ncbi:hypothetical protein QVD99_004972 [Batrachochytrium dendrobatidis]|nr:hypothetical protein O5D80_004585 [Batrachochytrium dendrobatidis]KAK5667921.1 hypothetical protein QVD99_004972 [Batrachochytrium dendrobatidis]
MDQDGFTLVVHRQRSSNKRSHIKNQKKTNANIAAHHSADKEKLLNSTLELPANFQLLIDSQVNVIRSVIFYKNFIDHIKPSIEEFKEPSTELDCVCYGLGSISDSKLAQFQFALLIIMIQELKFNRVYLFEPMLTQAESKFISLQGISIISENENGERKVHQKTLFYMPHCPIMLYNNVIKSNWDTGQYTKLAIIGNSFETYDLNSMGTSLGDKCPFIQSALTQGIVTETLFVDFEPLSHAFNNTALIQFKSFK